MKAGWIFGSIVGMVMVSSAQAAQEGGGESPNVVKRQQMTKILALSYLKEAIKGGQKKRPTWGWFRPVVMQTVAKALWEWREWSQGSGASYQKILERIQELPTLYAIGMVGSKEVRRLISDPEAVKQLITDYQEKDRNSPVLCGKEQIPHHDLDRAMSRSMFEGGGIETVLYEYRCFLKDFRIGSCGGHTPTDFKRRCQQSFGSQTPVIRVDEAVDLERLRKQWTEDNQVFCHFIDVPYQLRSFLPLTCKNTSQLDLHALFAEAAKKAPGKDTKRRRKGSI